MSTTDEPRWLTPEEMRTWLPLVGLVIQLPQALDRQLRVDAGISHVYYQILAMLSGAQERRLPMSSLARDTGTSLSRLSHAVTSLEKRGWVSRCVSDTDARVQVAILTDEGQQLLDLIAPAHVEEVRRVVFDRLTPDEVEVLGRISTRLLGGLTHQP
jgi:DNA-binding MarR family transcriptional regulator